MVDFPPKFFLFLIQICSPNIILRKNCLTKSNADFVQTVEEHSFKKWITTCKAQIALGVVVIFLLKN